MNAHDWAETIRDGLYLVSCSAWLGTFVFSKVLAHKTPAELAAFLNSLATRPWLARTVKAVLAYGPNALAATKKPLEAGAKESGLEVIAELMHEADVNPDERLTLEPTPPAIMAAPLKPKTLPPPSFRVVARPRVDGRWSGDPDKEP